ncbi:aminotransferase [Acrocarpospora phusangensis]|uniref:cysteine-S-conjugate beta-lyase n=1 Tax=Acrocarpospora phusangensis TaxID=1070424 RepID=A0A919QIN1_9ACTN|nr:aminotransferase class I/II-fold pyridoxal phosphate-dependent enzyme [Acrocarpospora phusangensis]GIH28551.1 aminotransferase [Acrocarpospora phusangensis]
MIGKLDELTLADAAVRDGLKWTQVRPGVIPAWVADMDFPPPEAVREAVARRVDTDLGYPNWLDDSVGPLAEAFAERMETRYGFQPDPGLVRTFSELNQILQIVLHLMTKPGDGVLVHTPTYNAFLNTLRAMDRRPVPMELTPDGETWHFELPSDIGATKVLLLVNPHNPTGHCFTRAELSSLAEFAERHDMIVISDEIHADLAFSPDAHIPFGTLLPDRTITLTSASKAFNMAGVRCAVAHLGHPAVRAAFDAQPLDLYGTPSVLGVDATIAAWRHGDAWLAEVLAILDRNRKLIAERMPAHVRYQPPAATYLAWLDFGIPDAADYLESGAGVRLNPGPLFGAPDGFARLNFGTSGPILEEMLTRITAALPTP